jgi:hypothetical protein
MDAKRREAERKLQTVVDAALNSKHVPKLLLTRQNYSEVLAKLLPEFRPLNSDDPTPALHDSPAIRVFRIAVKFGVISNKHELKKPFTLKDLRRHERHGPRRDRARLALALLGHRKSWKAASRPLRAAFLYGAIVRRGVAK